MSASEIQANEASKDTNVRKVGQSGLKLRIRLPRHKSLSDCIQIMSTGVPQNNENLTAKNVPEQTDNNTRSTTYTTAEVKAEECGSNPPGVSEGTKELSAKEKLRIRLPRQKSLSDGIQIMSTGVPQNNENLTAKNVPKHSDNNTRSTTCTAAGVNAEEECGSNPPSVPEDTKELSAKEVPKQTDNSTRSSSSMASKLMVGEVNSNRSGEGLCKEASSHNEGETLSRATSPEKVNIIAPGRNSETDTGVQGEEESSYHVKMRLCEEGNINILDKELSPENSSSTPVKESCNGVADKAPSKNLAITRVSGKVEKNYSVMGPCENATNNVLSNRLLCETNSNVFCKSLSEDAKINCLSKNVTTSAVKCKEANDSPVRTSPFEARNYMATETRSAGVRNNVPIRRPAVLANDKTSKKRPRCSLVHATTTGKNTSEMKLFPSVGQAVEQSSSGANLEAMKVYKDFEEKVRRTVYLDNLSHLVTEAVIKMALNQFGTVRNVTFLINYTVPYDIPQSALVEMETEKDAESVVSMLHEFPFMISGIPRPVRGKRATAAMFNDRPRKPGAKLEFRWVGPTDPDYQNVRKYKLMSKKHELENLALMKLELEGEELLAKQQQDNLDCNYRMLETVGTTTGWVGSLSHIYNMRFNGAF